MAYCKGLPLSRPAARPPALRRPSATVVAVAVDSGGNSAIVQFVLFWTVLPSESMFTAFAGDVSLHGLRMSVLAIALCVALSLMVWTVLVRIALRRGNLDLLLIPYVLLGLCATKYFSMHHIGIIFGLFVAQLWINAADMALKPADIPVLSHFGQPCTYEGRTFVPNPVPSAAQMNRKS